MRKGYIIIITVILMLGLVGCNSDNDISTDTSKNDIEIINISNERVSTENLTLLDEYSIDFDNDNIEESIELYTAAGRGPDGEMMWDDGQDFLLIVKDKEGEFILFNEYVQIGQIDLYVYTAEDNEFHITTLQPGSASMRMTDYNFNKDKKQFEKSIVFNPNNVNLMHSSNY